VKTQTTTTWNGNSGIPPPALEVELAAVEFVVVDRTEEEVELVVVELGAVELVAEVELVVVVVLWLVLEVVVLVELG